MKKQSKVYEAGEAVDGLHVKHTKMNHKKCTPGEFGAMVKEALDPAALAPLAGALIGGGAGALVGKKNRLRGALIGALAGGGVGGLAEYAVPGVGLGAKYRLQDLVGGKPELAQALGRLTEAGGYAARRKSILPGLLALYDMPKPDVSKSLAAVGDKALDVVNRGSDMANQALESVKGKIPQATGNATADKVLKTVTDNVPTNTQDAAVKALGVANKGLGALNSFLGGGHTKTQSARDFGAYVKQSFNINQYLPAAGVGAAAGAGLGALGGLINPGEEDEYDDQGRVVGRKQRSRFGAMLRNALMGAGAGGIVGGAGSALLPQYVDPQVRNFYQTMDYLGSFVRPNDVEQAPNQQQPKAPFTPLPAATTTAPMPGGKLRAHPGTKTRAQLQSDREQSLNSGEQIPEISFPNAG